MTSQYIDDDAVKLAPIPAAARRSTAQEQVAPRTRETVKIFFHVGDATAADVKPPPIVSLTP